MISSSSAGRRAAVWFFAFFLLGSFFAAAAQSPSSSGDSASAQSSSEKQPGKSTDATTAPAQSKKPRHVITDEDIAAYHSRNPDGSLNGKNAGGMPATGQCDDECAEEARQMTGFGPGQEGEWRIQLATARKSLREDTEWPAAYAQAARAVETYCTFQYQQEVAVLPSGNDWASQVERAKREKYAEEMGRVLMQNMTNANARINQLIQQAEDGEPVRAAIMRVLASRVNSACDDSEDP